jgi:hypothetical protein
MLGGLKLKSIWKDLPQAFNNLFFENILSFCSELISQFYLQTYLSSFLFQLQLLL